MFKVICINAGALKGADGVVRTTDNLFEGEIYTVIKVFTNITYNTIGYILKEAKSKDETGAYKAERFIPLSEIDETEMVREQQKVSV